MHSHLPEHEHRSRSLVGVVFHDEDAGVIVPASNKAPGQGRLCARSHLSPILEGWQSQSGFHRAKCTFFCLDLKTTPYNRFFEDFPPANLQI